MDLILHIADEYLFDRVWASLVPLSAFGSPELVKSFNGTSAAKYRPTFLASSSSSLSPWAKFVSHLPHPPLQDIASVYTATSSLSTLPLVSAWPRDYIPRQLLSLCVITLIGIHALYFLFAGFSYKFIFNHDMMRHPRFLKNQVKLEIQTSLRAFPVMMVLTLPWFQAEVMGYSKMYDGLDTYGYWYLVASVPL